MQRQGGNDTDATIYLTRNRFQNGIGKLFKQFKIVYLILFVERSYLSSMCDQKKSTSVIREKGKFTIKLIVHQIGIL